MKTLQTKVSTLRSSLCSLSASLSNKNCELAGEENPGLLIGQAFVQHNNNLLPLQNNYGSKQP